MKRLRDIVQPDDQLRRQAADLRAVLAAGAEFPVEVVCDGDAATVPPALVVLLDELCRDLADGRGVQLDSLPERVPIIFAASLLGMQRAKLDELIAQGQLRTVRDGDREFLLLSSMVDYDRRESERQLAALTRLTRQSEDIGYQ